MRLSFERSLPLKILHTADWHLGKIVHAVHMTEDQAFILDQFFEMIDTEEPDVVLISGDIYDRAIPPKEAVDLLDQTLSRLMIDYDFPVLITSGNHDSPDRLQFGRQLFKKNNLYIESKLSDPIETVTLHDAHGAVHFHLIPYFEPNEVRQRVKSEQMLTHQEAMDIIIQDLKKQIDLNERHVILAHTFIAGGMESESEERLSMIGGSPYIDVNVFDDFDYVALGHLHQPQQVKSKRVQYSGSLLKYSFSEHKHKKSVTLVNLGAKHQLDVRRIPLIPKCDFRVMTDSFETFMKQIEPSDDYLHIQLTDDAELIDPLNELRKKFPNILKLEYIRKQGHLSLEHVNKQKRHQTFSKKELFETFYEELSGEGLNEQRMKLLDDTLEALQKQEREG